MAITSRKSGEQVYPSKSGPRAGCRDCGCNDTRIVGASRTCRRCGREVGGVYVRPDAKARPRHDDGEGGAAVDAKVGEGRRETPSAVVYHETRCVCPACGKKNPRVTSKPEKNQSLRWHKCVCGETFKSFGV